MGSDVFVYFTLEDTQADSLHSAELEELAADSGRAETGATEEQVVARLDVATSVREGSQSELWADSRKVHVFDPQTGENLSLAGASA
jgi:multiple sugar transport system ATP-binding protein